MRLCQVPLALAPCLYALHLLLAGFCADAADLPSCSVPLFLAVFPASHTHHRPTPPPYIYRRLLSRFKSLSSSAAQGMRELPKKLKTAEQSLEKLERLCYKLRLARSEFSELPPEAMRRLLNAQRQPSEGGEGGD